jgi:flavin-dependent dehydrogenase
VSREQSTALRIAVIGGGPAGSFFALYALKYAAEANRKISVTIYETRDFWRPGLAGCNKCAGLVPPAVFGQFGSLGVSVPPELIYNRIDRYSLNTPAGALTATEADPRARIVATYRGAGPRPGHPDGSIGFDGLMIEEAISRGARLRRRRVQAIRRGQPVEVVSEGEGEYYDLAVLATGINAESPALEGFAYRPPPTSSMCQTELYLGQREVEARLGTGVHIFLPADDIAAYGILIPKGPFVTVSLLGPRSQMSSMKRFLDLPEVRAVVGSDAHRLCGCLPRVSVGLAQHVCDDGFVAIGDAGATRLYKNGIGSALAAAERAAWTAVTHGCARADFERHYMPLCRRIDRDNWFGKLLFLEVPLLKRFGPVARAHYRLAADGKHRAEAELQARILWGMFTGAHSYRDLFGMAMSPRLIAQMLLALGGSIFERPIRRDSV